MLIVSSSHGASEGVQKRRFSLFTLKALLNKSTTLQYCFSSLEDLLTLLVMVKYCCCTLLPLAVGGSLLMRLSDLSGRSGLCMEETAVTSSQSMEFYVRSHLMSYTTPNTTFSRP